MCEVDKYQVKLTSYYFTFVLIHMIKTLMDEFT